MIGIETYTVTFPEDPENDKGLEDEPLFSEPVSIDTSVEAYARAVLATFECPEGSEFLLVNDDTREEHWFTVIEGKPIPKQVVGP